MTALPGLRQRRRHRGWTLVLATLLLLSTRLLGVAQPIRVLDGDPAFLDAADAVTLWLDQASTLAGLPARIEVQLNGRRLPIRAVEARQPARPPVGANDLIVAGTLQRALGGTEWDPAGLRTRMTRLPDGTFELVVALPAGRWEYKIAQGGGWERNWGRGYVPAGDNVVLIVPKDNTVVRILVDPNKGMLADSINQPDQVTAPAVAPAVRTEAMPAATYDSVSVRLARPLPVSAFRQTLRVRVDGGKWRPIIVRDALDVPALMAGPEPLGATWSAKSTTFRVWSPVSRSVRLRLFPNASGPASRTLPMTSDARGVWSITVPGNLHGTFYQYVLNSYGKERVAADLYSVAASADSQRSMVADLAQTNPPGWPAPRPFAGRPTDAVIYEAHIRDLTVDPSSGVRPEWRGKYLGLAQTGTTTPDGRFPTGLDYLKGLGVTHLHLLPWQNFNPAHSEQYNWGYETTLFDVPEEQYSTRRDDPLTTIREAKTMVAALQRAGIGAVLDVVYNHTVPSEGPLSAFWETVPYYWFRTNDRGDVLNESGVGNALQDERPMVRRFVRDSLLFWIREYRMDGFRFDLLGMFTPETVIDVTRAMRREFPAIILYGEPWTGGGPTRFGKGAQRNTGMAVFNDRFRGAFRGDLDGTNAGFMKGGGDRAAVKRAVVGSVEYSDTIRDFAASPEESINYVSAHDNLTLRDRIAATLTDPVEQQRALRLAHAAVLLSQGIPFLEGGPQIGRTKGMNRNSYNAGDEVNRYDWAKAPQFAADHEYVRGLIALRRAHPAFRLPTTKAIQQHLKFLPEAELPDGAVAWTLDGRAVGDSWGTILVVLYGGRTTGQLKLPPGTWNVAVDDQSSSVTGRKVSGTLALAPLSATVLYQP